MDFMRIKALCVHGVVAQPTESVVVSMLKANATEMSRS
jgi:hypothetical protein